MSQNQDNNTMQRAANETHMRDAGATAEQPTQINNSAITSNTMSVLFVGRVEHSPGDLESIFRDIYGDEVPNPFLWRAAMALENNAGLTEDGAAAQALDQDEVDGEGMQQAIMQSFIPDPNIGMDLIAPVDGEVMQQAVMQSFIPDPNIGMNLIALVDPPQLELEGLSLEEASPQGDIDPEPDAQVEEVNPIQLRIDDLEDEAGVLRGWIERNEEHIESYRRENDDLRRGLDETQLQIDLLRQQLLRADSEAEQTAQEPTHIQPDTPVDGHEGADEDYWGRWPVTGPNPDIDLGPQSEANETEVRKVFQLWRIRSLAYKECSINRNDQAKRRIDLTNLLKNAEVHTSRLIIDSVVLTVAEIITEISQIWASFDGDENNEANPIEASKWASSLSDISTHEELLATSLEDLLAKMDRADANTLDFDDTLQDTPNQE